MLKKEVLDRVELDVTAYLSGRNRKLGETLDQRARALSAAQGALSGAAMMAYIEAAQDELIARADYIGDALRRAHQNQDGGFDAQLRGDLKADLVSRIASNRDDIFACVRPRMARNTETILQDTLANVATEKGARYRITLDEYCDGLERAANEERKKVPDTNITSHGQQGGITAQNVTVHNTAQPPLLPPEPKRPWWKSVWVWVAGAVTFAAALAKVLGYLGVAPWEHK